MNNLPSDTQDYNIPSNNRELQLKDCRHVCLFYYNIPSNNRELQPTEPSYIGKYDYNIPSNNRELQHQLLQQYL